MAAVHQVVHGVTNPEDSTVNALADALRVDRRTVAAWVGASRQERDSWQPPEGADRLTRAERDVLNQLIRVMTEGRDGHDQQPAPITTLPTGPSAAALDPTIPEDVAARDTGEEPELEKLRRAQDEDAEKDG